MMIAVLLIVEQGNYQTVAEALRNAVVSVLGDETMRYKDSFYYWAGFISHGYASTKLDDPLLELIHSGMVDLDQTHTRSKEDDSNRTFATILALTRDAYLRQEDQDQTLSREWRAKMGHATGFIDDPDAIFTSFEPSFFFSFFEILARPAGYKARLGDTKWQESKSSDGAAAGWCIAVDV